MNYRPWVRAVAMTLTGAALWACSDGPTDPTLTDAIVLERPVGGTKVATDSPTFVVRNATGFDEGEATYTFRVVTAASRLVAKASVPAGRRQTALIFPDPLLRGALLSWQVTATRPDGVAIVSAWETFRLPPVVCRPVADPYAKSVLDWWIPSCSLEQNHYDDPSQVVGPPNAYGQGPDGYFGFLSLGMGGWVDVDMEACVVDGPGDDIRVHQFVSREPATLYASGGPLGPWILVEFRKECGTPTPGLSGPHRHCAFDLGRAGIEEARYFKIEDGESFPCPGGTPTEGPDIDAVEILNFK